MSSKLLKIVVILLLFSSLVAPNVWAETIKKEEVPLEETATQQMVVLKNQDVFSEQKSQEVQSLKSKYKNKKIIKVIIELNTSFQPEGKLAKESKSKQRKQIETVQDSVKEDLMSILPEQAKSVKTFKTVPYITLEVDENGLDALHKNPNVKSIVEDIPMLVGLPLEKESAVNDQQMNTKEKGNSIDFPSLAESTNVINADAAWSQGFTGEGQAVAILDTGVDKSHSFLAGKVISEACYSTNNYYSGIESLCPSGVSQSVEINSGLDCSGLSGCGHGTHVAGIAAGNGESFSGVAKDANIIAIKVFSKFPSYQCNGAPCAMSYSSDQIRALERVYELSSEIKISAVNMSLGGGRYYSTCSDPRKGIIDNLKSIGIATVISSGNESYKDSVGAPGCIETAVTVGATDNSDNVTYFSNSASFIDLLAPGYFINSSINGGGFGYKSGTSMAAPHVTGAWAVIKEKYPNASVDEIAQMLENTGKPVRDTNGITKPRIDLGWMLNSNELVDIYLEDFEKDTGRYSKTGTSNSSWEWGTPTIGPTSSVTKVWGTNLNGSYNSGEQSYIESPTIDLTGVKSLINVSWDQWLELENSWDYSRVEVSKDGGQTWTVKDTATGNQPSWRNKSITLDHSYGVSNFKMRFGIVTDSSITYNGVYIDNVKISGDREKLLEINSVTANVKGPTTVDTPITWTVDGTGVTYAWYVYKGTTKVATYPYSSSKTLKWTPKEGGDYRVKVYAKDSEGKSVSKQSAVIKVTNPVKINSVTANIKGSTTVDTPITWTVDGNGNGVKYAWYVYKGTTKVATYPYSSNKTLKWTPKEGGDYRVKVYAKDSEGKSVSKQSVVIKVTNPVKINSVTANIKGSTTVDTPITWTVDGNGNGVKYAWYVYKGTTKVATYPYSSSKTLKWTPKEAGDYRVKVYAKDSEGKSVSRQSVVITVNSVKINSVTANIKDTSTVDKPITWTVDGKGNGVKYAWYVYKGTTKVATYPYSSSKTLKWTPKEAGDYRVKVYAKDSEGKSVSKQSAVIKVTKPTQTKSVAANAEGLSTIANPITWTIDGKETGIQNAWYTYKG
ncbi:S8 family serine peptidase [Neobacillus niacini]|uniref:S8 family serine peptidase n=1 Tax=Neobacillus niacini TaxID=86668 RepID=UPI001C8CFED9|nr:S8 family serine peptidase [Neobacillus niacini]MBY0145082.1 S8 family serine peptidase [Neobacillus niacini]